MADIPRVTVPVDTFNGDNVALAASISALLEAPDASLSARVPGMAKQLLASAAARLSAAPAPEGGADAWRIRTKENLHGDGAPPGRWIVSNILSLSSDTAHWYEIQPLRVSEPSQVDLDAMEAYGVKVAALATREEAPAEAGEGDVRGLIGEAIQGLERAIASTRYDSASKKVFAACIDDFRKVLRAQPPALSGEGQ